MATSNSDSQDLIDEKVVMYVEDTKENKQSASSESYDNKPGSSQEANPIKEEIIEKLSNILEDLKNQKDEFQGKRIVKNTDKRRNSVDSNFKPNLKRKRSDLEENDFESSEEDRYIYTVKSPRKCSYDSDSSLSSNQADSCVSQKLKEELSSILGRSFISKLAKHEKYPRSRSRSKYSRRESSHERSKYSRRESSRERSKSQKHSYDRRHSSQRYSSYNNYHNQYRQRSHGADMEERYSRYYAVMYAFSIIMDILRQDDIYTTF